jgi:SAM-dependent methyltransferase
VCERKSLRYQRGFYNLSKRVRDPRSRQRQADKIIYVFTKLVSTQLSSSTCLDLGCSAGMITNAIAPLFARTFGIDYDEIALRHISHDGNVRSSFIRADAMNIPMDSASIDVIICAQVYEHVPDDTEMVYEIFRVLKAGGIVFFSGPNKLYPIEPHYSLPFLHWFPPNIADGYLRLLGWGNQYSEQSRTLWGLRRLLSDFNIYDVTVQVLIYRINQSGHQRLAKFLENIPGVVWKLVTPFFPNFNWILYKVEDHTELSQSKNDGKCKKSMEWYEAQ